jgi:hypothetical protein
VNTKSSGFLPWQDADKSSNSSGIILTFRASPSLVVPSSSSIQRSNRSTWLACKFSNSPVAAPLSLQLDAGIALQIVKTGAELLVLAFTVAIGIAAVAGGGACGAQFNEMRVQLHVKQTNVISFPVTRDVCVFMTVLRLSLNVILEQTGTIVYDCALSRRWNLFRRGLE